MVVIIFQHFTEVYFRLFYICAGFFISILISYLKLNTLLLLNLHPLLTIDKYHKFIMIELNESFFVSVHLTLTISFVVTFPLLCWHLFHFLKSGWYFYQSVDLYLVLRFCFVFYTGVLILNYFIVLSWVYTFFIYSLNTYKSIFWRISFESSLFHYTKFTIKILFSLTNLSLYFLCISLFILLSKNKKTWLSFLLKYQKPLFFIFITLNSVFFFDLILFLFLLTMFFSCYFLMIFILCCCSFGEIGKHDRFKIYSF